MFFQKGEPKIESASEESENKGIVEEMPESIEPDQLELDRAEDLLTPEDRERIASLIDAMGDNSIVGRDISSVEEMIALRIRLRDEGGKAVAYILEDIESLDVYDTFQRIDLLQLCATSEEAHEIGDLLLSDQVSLIGDRSSKGMVLRILERIGTSENVDQIVEFAEKIFDASYDSTGANLYYSDNQDAIETLFAILERTTDEVERERIMRSGVDSIVRNAQEHGIEGFSQERLSRMRSLVSNDDRLELFENEFRLPNESFYDRYDSYDAQDYPYGHDDEIDQEIEEGYHKAEFQKMESRLDTLKRLHHEAQKEKGIEEEPEEEEARFLRRHWLEYREENPSPYTPTLGIEIEIRERTVLPKEAKLWTLDQRIQFLDERRDQYLKTEKMGIPPGKDAFWEFAHAPVRGYLTLSREVQALIEMGLINKEYKKHSLHLTIGGITSEGEKGTGAFELARVLEASGWSTTGGRLLRPYLVDMRCWGIKGRGGIKERHRSEIKLGVDTAVEMRTFQLQGISGLNRLLRSSFLLGTALKASQESSPPKGGDAETHQALALVWEKFSQDWVKILEEFEMNSSVEKWVAPSPHHTQEERESNDFVSLANLLNEAQKHPQSRGAKFVHHVRGLIINTNARVAEIIEGSEIARKAKS